MVFLPAALILIERRCPEPTDRPDTRVYTGGVVEAVCRYPRSFMLVSLPFMVAAAVIGFSGGSPFAFEPDLTVMHPRPNPPLEAQAHIAGRMNSGSDSVLVHLQAENPQRLIRLAHQVQQRLARPQAKEAGVLSSYGLASLLPDPMSVPDRLEQVGPGLAKQVVGDFYTALEHSRFNPEAFSQYADFLKRVLTAPRAPGIEDLLAYPQLAKSILPRGAFDHDGPHESIVLIFLSHPMNDRSARQDRITRLRAVLADCPGATLTGMAIVSDNTETALRRDLPRLVGVAMVAVTAYLLVHFRSIRAAVLAVVPAVFSLACLAAFMRLSGRGLNPVNLVAIPLLIGIDLDYGIFIVNAAHRRSDPQELISHLRASGHAILLCSASTVLGFGSLVTASVPAIGSLGWTVGVGVVSCVAGTFFLLIPGLVCLQRSRA